MSESTNYMQPIAVGDTIEKFRQNCTGYDYFEITGFILHLNVIFFVGRNIETDAMVNINPRNVYKVVT